MQINLFEMAAALSDVELIRDVKRLAANERQTTAQLVAHLAEMDRRRLYLGEGCSSLFTYCTQVLHLSDHAAYGRIEAARAVRTFPLLLEAIAGGALHLTAVTLIAPHLTVENVDRVIAAATHRTRREVEELVAALRPQLSVPSSVRKLPQTTQATSMPKAALVHGDLPVDSRESAAPPTADVIANASAAPGADAAVEPGRAAAIKPLAPEQYLVKLPRPGQCTRSCEKRRHCCGTRCRQGMWPRSSIEHSPCYWRIFGKPGMPPPPGRALRIGHRRPAGTSRRP